MMKYFFTLLFSFLTISVMAETPRLSRNDLGQVTIIRDHVSDVSSMSDPKSAQSLQQFMRERNLTLSDNLLNKRSPRRLNLEDMEGVRIASCDAYNFYWDYTNQIAIVDNTTYAMQGRYCKITHSASNGNTYLSFFYDAFKIPIEIDVLTGNVTIKAGRILSSIEVIESIEQPMLSSNALNSQGVKVFWRLYAMPLSWLTGDDDNYDVIHGHIAEGGTILFDDDFALLIKSESMDGYLRGWRLSPIFKNLMLLTPNGNHSFTYYRPDDGNDVIRPVGYGYGGLVPRKPPTSKPVSSIRPFSSLIGAQKLSSNSNRFSLKKIDTLHSHLQELERIVGPVVLPDGYGGLVPPRRPGNPNPSNPRLSGAISLNQAHDYDRRQAINSVAKTRDLDSWIPVDTLPFDTLQFTLLKKTNMEVPVYMFLIDDTLVVYNLFGLGNRCHMEINRLDHTIHLPSQEIYNDGLGSVIFNRAVSGTSLDSFTWNITRIYNDNGDYTNHTFENNILSFADAEPYSATSQPSFDEPFVTDTSVVFSVTAPYPNDVFLYMYDDGIEDYLGVSNPLVIPRVNEPYWVYLAAQAYNPNTFVYSEITRLKYEVPASGAPITSLRGDVNDDQDVNISDVTAMIDGLLSGNWDNRNYDNADCNLDGDVNISDVTALIDYLLSGHWPD